MHENSVTQTGFPYFLNFARWLLSASPVHAYQCVAMKSTLQLGQAAKKASSQWNGSVSLQLPAQYCGDGEPISRFLSFAICSMRGHSVAAIAAVMFDWSPRFGSLKPRMYFEPAGICFSIVAGSGRPPFTPQTMGTNSTPAVAQAPADFSGAVDQL